MNDANGNLRTSAEWKETDTYRPIVMLDCSGWDMVNFHFSWLEERISENVFRARLYSSKLMHGTYPTSTFQTEAA